MSEEKTQAPTAKRREEAARKGDVLRSREAATAGAVLVGALWLKLAGPWMLAALADITRAGLTWDRATLDGFAPAPLLLGALAAVLPPVMVLAVAVGLVVAALQLAPGDGRWVGASALPRAARINPAAGLKRMFGATGWIEVGKNIAKLVVLGLIVWLWLGPRLPALFALARAGSVGGALAAGWNTLTGLVLALSAGLVLIAVADAPVQAWRRLVRLRMSHQELRDEHKQAEGSPERKAAQRQRQQQLASGTVARAMREAQFVLANPSHFAVAMAYDPARAAAPLVLAKGRGDKAQAMKILARELAVPMLEYPVLARSVYFTTREGAPIREELYAAVAAVLAYVLSLRRGEAVVPPPVSVPLALRFDADGRPDPAGA